jgi:hypothetical protein
MRELVWYRSCLGLLLRVLIVWYALPGNSPWRLCRHLSELMSFLCFPQHGESEVWFVNGEHHRLPCLYQISASSSTLIWMLLRSSLSSTRSIHLLFRLTFLNSSIARPILLHIVVLITISAPQRYIIHCLSPEVQMANQINPYQEYAPFDKDCGWFRSVDCSSEAVQKASDGLPETPVFRNLPARRSTTTNWLSKHQPNFTEIFLSTSILNHVRLWRRRRWTVSFPNTHF